MRWRATRPRRGTRLDRRRDRPALRSVAYVRREYRARPEEWGALERRHVDRARRIVRVEQRNVDGRIVLGGKTRNSVREVPLTRLALGALDAIPPRLDTTLLFPAPGGGLMNVDNFRKRVWAPAVDAAGVRTPATPYDMRDTFTSNALHAGVTVFELAKVMGTSVRMIERHYGARRRGARGNHGPARRARGQPRGRR